MAASLPKNASSNGSRDNGIVSVPRHNPPPPTDADAVLSLLSFSSSSLTPSLPLFMVSTLLTEFAAVDVAVVVVVVVVVVVSTTSLPLPVTPVLSCRLIKYCATVAAVCSRAVPPCCECCVG